MRVNRVAGKCQKPEPAAAPKSRLLDARITLVQNGAPLAPMWCGVVQREMAPANRKSLSRKTRRLSVSLSGEQHAEVLALAHKNRVSTAWVVREAIERLLTDEMPLFHLRRPR
jgi:hypothetical protein